MNGDEKEEAHRPRPLSAGIWTLFSWLRRSERSSSSESVSSVGSDRTAVSFDFLAPGKYNFTNTPIVLTTPLNPPTETYKRRLEDRNLRRQRDRDVTLHRKYGLLREHGSGYDGFTLPTSRRTLGNTVDRPNRERRATSECLQRRAAYVPGKRRAPLPPAITTSSSLPRTYKRKRPAPKPPIKTTFKDNNNIVQLINNPVRMTSNSESEEKFVPDNELLNSSKTQKCDKKVTASPKDTKSRTDKNFLRHIFENRKRSSVIETTSVRLLPNISELDKQATEIIESNKLRLKKNNVNVEDFNNSQVTDALYEANSWFCTKCLRKYNSTVDSCNYCLHDKNLSLNKDDLKSPRSSTYTQTNINVETETSSRSSDDERKMLKEILKEMKDSLPKKNKDRKVNDVITEIPTLRIGATIQETYKELPSQPSSSKIINDKNRIRSLSPLLSQAQSNYNRKPIIDEMMNVLSNKKNSELKNFNHTSEFGNKNNVPSTSARISPSRQKYSSSPKNERREKNINDIQEMCTTKVTQNKNVDKTELTDSVNIKNGNQAQSQLLFTKTNDINKNKLQVTHEASSNIIDRRQNLLKDQIHLDNTSNYQNKVASSAAVANNMCTKSELVLPKSDKDKISIIPDMSNISKKSDIALDLGRPKSQQNQVSSTPAVTEKFDIVLPKPNQKQVSTTPTSVPTPKSDTVLSKSDQNQVSLTPAITKISTQSAIVLPMSSKLHFFNYPVSRDIIVNSVTVVTAHSNTKPENKTSLENTRNNSILSREQSERKVTEIPLQTNNNPDRNVKVSKQTNLVTRENVVKYMETSSDNDKPLLDLHTPLKISSLLNPVCSSSKNSVKENSNIEKNASKNFQTEICSNSNAIPTLGIDITDPKVNKRTIVTDSPQLSVATSSDLKSLCQGKDEMKSQINETVTKEHLTNNATLKDVLYEQKAMPSTSGCSSNMKSKNNVDKINHYDERRHLISLLEQSIAKGDEVAAAEAAVKLAKLRLSCSVLSFSSQIVGEISSAKDNEKSRQHNALDSITSSSNKPLEHSIPLPPIPETVEHADKNTQEIKSVPVNAVLQNKEGPSNGKPQLSISGPSSSTQVISEDIVPINVCIEDKQAARGPIRLNISKRATMADLRRQAELSLGLATELQRWIIGRTLCSDDASPIVSLAGPHLRAPFYLCIVQPDENYKPATDEVISDSKNNNGTDQNGEFYTELMKLEKQSLVPNIEPFECGVCMEECAAGAGVILRECIHTFCRDCLADVVQHSQEPAVACPATGCSGFLQEREIRTIVTNEEYERWLARGLATAECGTRNAFHCRTRDCTGWAFCDPGVRRFPCPVCKNTNCVQCQAIHEGETCEQYQTKLRQAVAAAETNKDDEGTQALLNSLMSRGEALECPECKAIITKKWGCDWVKCSACKTEICWVTKGRRWGPGGRGDTSGGCRCGVNGQRCHPSCGYCH